MLSDYLLCKSYVLSPDELEQIVQTTLHEAKNPHFDERLLSLKIARIVSGVGACPVPAHVA